MKIIEVDSQILNSIQNCALKHDLQFIQNLSPESKAAPLEKGSLLHSVLELYDGLMGNCYDLESETWRAIQGQDFYGNFIGKLARERPEIIDFCLQSGNYLASKMQIDSETAANVLFQFKEYCEYYKNDPWSTLAVEEVGSRILFENSEIKIIYTGKIDRFVEQGSIRAPMDHKSSERRGDVSSMSNQFIGYCFLLNCNQIIIDKIGFQKTLKPSERFQRFVLTIDDGRIAEWKLNATRTILLHLAVITPDLSEASSYFEMYRAFDLGKVPQPLMNLTSCDKYGGCIYRNICESSPEGREWTKERDFVVRESWDVGSILEAKS